MNYSNQFIEYPDKLMNYSDEVLYKSKEFFDANSMVSKVVFLLLVLIIFMTLLRFGFGIIGWFMLPSGNIHIMDGMIDAKFSQHIPSNPNIKNSKPIIRSVNKKHGIEFTWSTWIFIEDLEYKKNQYRHIFHKGNDKINYSQSPIGLNHPNNGPGLYITPNTNDLLIIMNTFEKIDEKIIIKDIPLNKWINIVIRCENTTVDVYINGTIVKSHKCNSVPFQNYGDVYTTLNGGFSGYLSNLWYWNSALSSQSIKSIVSNGPNLTIKNNKNLSKAKPNYFSLRWFFNNSK
tara:strand:- start:20 stop:886 length:867 start_codon:yes stop_codon:yes gene_type:complete